MKVKLIIPLICILFIATDTFAFNPEIFHERKKTVVYIEYFVQMEVDRQAREAVGLVVDDSGLIVCLENAFATWIPPERFKDIEAYTPEDVARKGFPLSYLGQDSVNGWHYLRLDDLDAMEYLTPISNYPVSRPEVGQKLWGFGMTNGDVDYFPYFQDGRLSTIQKLPRDTGFTTVEIAVPGGPLFDFDGNFIGWSMPSFPLDRDLWIGGEYYQANLRNPDESFTFLLAEPFLKDLGKAIPATPTEDKRGWLGIVGSQALDKDTAEFLGLEDQGAVVVSEVLPDSPADLAGLKGRDIILGLDGERFPRLRPISIVLSEFERRLVRKSAGDSVSFMIVRGEEKMEVVATLGESPKKLKAAQIIYFKNLGFSLREFLFGDAVQRRVDYRELKGVVVSYVRQNSPAASAELYGGDWILEINGEAVSDLSMAEEILNNEITSEEIVLLIRRGNETSVLRITPDQ